ncbi:hypothetical protein BDU57DRAFT_351560 [Ampelomyces quisqualis]|uniref:Uncharacterized protein n=1 Tax=Ampelomyces quisqualis TaxID=50730 RepID=A0A6A5QDA6_AMPQU|nr:hypothetical protein BDU57DRAFT_351560 [Ampelomyces quisqualis]
MPRAQCNTCVLHRENMCNRWCKASTGGVHVRMQKWALCMDEICMENGRFGWKTRCPTFASGHAPPLYHFFRLFWGCGFARVVGRLQGGGVVDQAPRVFRSLNRPHNMADTRNSNNEYQRYTFGCGGCVVITLWNASCDACASSGDGHTHAARKHLQS